MSDRGLTCLADFERVRDVDVEAHLTDLAVDGNIAPSTQNGSFHALLKFFVLVLKRDMDRIEAIRTNKGKQISTVMSPREVDSVLSKIQRLLGHSDVKTTEIYTPVLDPKQLDVISPLDRLIEATAEA